MIIYADTSGLAKLFLDESGTAEMRESESRDSLLLDLERLWGEITPIAVDDALLRNAGDLAALMQLRAYDAVHLAALVSLRRQEALGFACWDRDLRDAARSLGYQLIPETM